MQQEVAKTLPNNVKLFLKSRSDDIGIIVALIGLCIIMTILSPTFLTVNNLLNILQQISVISIIAVGMTFVIIQGGIDLSVGSIVAFTGLIMAGLMKNEGWNVGISVLTGILVGVVLGLINGVLVAEVKLPPFIATLGMMSLARGAAFTISGGQPIYTLPESFDAISGKIGIIPIPALIMIGIYLLASYVLKYTKLGRYTYAIGGNEVATILSGINVKLYKIAVYVISGLCCAISSILLTARLDSAVPVAADGYELDAIAAVVIGGTSMMGGEGKISGTFIGALIIGIVNNGLNLLAVPQGPQRMIKGAIIVAAVAFDILRKRRQREK